MSRIGAITFKELLQLKRDRLTFGMVVMIPLIQLLLFGFAMNTNIRHVPAGLVDQSNRSGLAVGQTLVAVMENNQQADGPIRIADALKFHLGGLDIIESIRAGAGHQK